MNPPSTTLVFISPWSRQICLLPFAGIAQQNLKTKKNKVINVLLIYGTSYTEALGKALYIRSKNISVSNFNAHITRSDHAKNILDCGYKCTYWREIDSSYCNALSYNNISQLCELAYLTFLEEPNIGYAAKTFHIEVDEIEKLPMYCRGGEHCCYKGHKNRCIENEGDCDTDEDCDGSLVCGKNNCLKTRSPGGLYDEFDDCCTRPCTPETPCSYGMGHCESSDDCKYPWLTCGNDNCKDTLYFPVDKYPYNHSPDSYSDTENCCYKPCIPIAQCNTNVFGCETDDDCLSGLYCNKDDHHCRDINECDALNGKVAGYAECGRYTTCTNQDKTFSCQCQTGFKDYEAFEGCVDKNECIEGGHNCKLDREYCFNTIGSFVCVCKEGYTGNAPGGCKDVDECANGFHNCTSYITINTETSALDGGTKVFNVGPYNIADGEEHIFTFDLQSFTGCHLKIGNETSVYQVTIGPNLVNMKYISNMDVTAGDVALNHAEHSKLGKDFISYHVKFIKTSEGMVISFGAFGQDYPGNFKFSSYPENVTQLGFSTYIEFSYWRNVRKGGPSQTCTNTIGSYKCTDDSEESVAVGFGGHSKSGTDMPTDVTVMTKDLFYCSSHLIPNIVASRNRLASAVLNNWIYYCGGKPSGSSTPTAECKRFDLTSTGLGWETAAALPVATFGHAMVTYKQSIYVLGGYYPAKSKNINYELNSITNYWTNKARIPYAIHYHDALADEDNGRIWIFGGGQYGVGHKPWVYYYLVDSNSWHHHSNFPYNSEDPSCQITKNHNNDYKLIMCALGHRPEGIYTYNLDLNTGWHKISSLYAGYKQRTMRMVKFDTYNLALLSGWSQLHTQSLKNVFVYDVDTKRFHFNYKFLQNPGDEGTWITVPKSKKFKALTNCVAERTYAVVGWGGHTSSVSDYNPYWSVILHQKNKGDFGMFQTCHRRAIPILSPGRYKPGVTAVGYKLILCGGNNYGVAVTASCFYLDTNTPQESPSWLEMDDMLYPRRGFAFVTYGDVAFAFGGNDVKITRAQVDIWTESKGWEVSKPLPKGLQDHCGVADEGHNRIYILGGYSGTSNKNAYYYDVVTDTWVTMPSTSYAYINCGCTIINSRGHGHRLLVISGNNQAYSQTYDLTDYEAGKVTKWISRSVYQKSWGNRIVSLSPSEALQLGGYSANRAYSPYNIGIFNPESYKFEDTGLIRLDHNHVYGDWSRIPADAWILANCTAL